MRLMATLLPFSMADHSLCTGTLCYLFSAYNLAQTEISIKGASSMAKLPRQTLIKSQSEVAFD